MDFPLTEQEYQEGQILLIDKPLDWTSFDVVKKIRSELKRKFNIKKIKVGHAGTLDPKATGLLVVCTGKQTKKIDQIQAQQKTYTGRFKLGATTPSFDSETAEENQKNIDSISDKNILDATKFFEGTIEQTPPIYSAIKMNGERLYKIARRGDEIEIKTRKIEILSFEISRIEKPFVDFAVVCTKGTYIRSLADDFGKKLGCGAYLFELRRTKIGDFSIDDAQKIID